jgi:hypothetical protein
MILMILILWILRILVILGLLLIPTNSYGFLIIVMLLYIYSGLTSCQLKHLQAIHSILRCAYNHSYSCDFYKIEGKDSHSYKGILAGTY